MTMVLPELAGATPPEHLTAHRGAIQVHAAHLLDLLTETPEGSPIAGVLATRPSLIGDLEALSADARPNPFSDERPSTPVANDLPLTSYVKGLRQEDGPKTPALEPLVAALLHHIDADPEAPGGHDVYHVAWNPAVTSILRQVQERLKSGQRITDVFAQNLLSDQRRAEIQEFRAFRNDAAAEGFDPAELERYGDTLLDGADLEFETAADLEGYLLQLATLRHELVETRHFQMEAENRAAARHYDQELRHRAKQAAKYDRWVQETEERNARHEARTEAAQATIVRVGKRAGHLAVRPVKAALALSSAVKAGWTKFDNWAGEFVDSIPVAQSTRLQ